MPVSAGRRPPRCRVGTKPARTQDYSAEAFSVDSSSGCSVSGKWREKISSSERGSGNVRPGGTPLRTIWSATAAAAWRRRRPCIDRAKDRDPAEPLAVIDAGPPACTPQREPTMTRNCSNVKIMAWFVTEPLRNCNKFALAKLAPFRAALPWRPPAPLREGRGLFGAVWCPRDLPPTRQRDKSRCRRRGTSRSSPPCRSPPGRGLPG